MILALDIASVTGWCVGTAGDRPMYGSVRLMGKGASDGSLLASMADWLGDMIALYKPSRIVYEAPLPQQTNINAAKIALRLSGVVELISWRKNIRCGEAHVKTVRKAVVGNGNARKPEVVEWVRCTLQWPVPTVMGVPDYDSCDAIAVWAFSTGLTKQ